MKSENSRQSLFRMFHCNACIPLPANANLCRRAIRSFRAGDEQEKTDEKE